MATHSSILAWRIPGTKDWRATVHGVAKSQTELRDTLLQLTTYVVVDKQLIPFASVSSFMRLPWKYNTSV